MGIITRSFCRRNRKEAMVVVVIGVGSVARCFLEDRNELKRRRNR